MELNQTFLELTEVMNFLNKNGISRKRCTKLARFWIFMQILDRDSEGFVKVEFNDFAKEFDVTRRHIRRYLSILDKAKLILREYRYEENHCLYVKQLSE
jgi:predicted AAA+ superfamily ATPase